MRALVFDFETTGLTLHPNAKPHLQPRAIEFACVLLNAQGAILAEDSWLINPGVAIDAEITKITGITNDDLAPAAPFMANYERLVATFEGVDVLVAHNLPFDHAILSNELAIAGRLADWRWPRHGLCTAQTYEPLWGRRPRLIELFEAVTGRVYEQTHRALDDVRALATVVAQERLLEFIDSLPAAAGPDRVQLPTGFRADRPGGCPAG